MAYVVFDYVSEQDLVVALEIEQAGFPEEEAATAATFRFRRSQAPQLFLGAYLLQASSRRLLGYVCATQSPDKTLKHESMSTHVPGSSSVCIHSICVSPSHRRQGLGLALLKEYISRLERARLEEGATWDMILLLAHDDLIPFYEKAGFENGGRSSVVHGPLPWVEMRKRLISQPVNPLADVPGVAPDISPEVFQALQRRRAPPTSKLLSDFHGRFSDLIESADCASGASTNKYDLLCPRGECGSIILKKGVGKWVERASVQMEPTGAQNPHLPSLPEPPETAQWWLITPSPMEFENIGFTRPIQPLTELGRKIKLLTCAECDLAPLGWSEEGGSEFWLACSRVAYRV